MFHTTTVVAGTFYRPLAAEEVTQVHAGGGNLTVQFVYLNSKSWFANFSALGLNEYQRGILTPSLYFLPGNHLVLQHFLL